MRHDTTTRILSREVIVSNDSMVTGLNNNDIIIGNSGAGKTRSYVLPNLLHAEGVSLIVCDTKGKLLKESAPTLKKKGYQIWHLDFTDCLHSPYGYNPLDAIRYEEKNDTFYEQDILKLSSALIPIENRDDIFWDLAARQYFDAILGYMLCALPFSEHHLMTAKSLLFQMHTGNFTKLMDQLNEEKPDCFAVRQYEMIATNQKAEKMDASIKGVLSEKLNTYIFDGALSLYQNPKKIDVAALRKAPVAVFLSVSDTDRSMDKLASLFFTQALQALCNTPVPEDESVPFYPVQLYLDDFASGIRIPDFDSVISIIRSRHIGVSIILQSLSQLESLYGIPASKTILNNFDHMLYLGGTDVDTCRYIGVRADKSAQAVLSLPLDEAWLFERGSAPRRVKK